MFRWSGKKCLGYKRKSKHIISTNKSVITKKIFGLEPDLERLWKKRNDVIVSFLSFYEERTKGGTVDLIGGIFNTQISFFASDVSKMLIQTALENIVLKI